MRYFIPLAGMAQLKRLTIAGVDKDVEQLECFYIAGRNAKWYIYFGKQFGGFL